jgi:hypothetical protein
MPFFVFHFVFSVGMKALCNRTKKDYDVLKLALVLNNTPLYTHKPSQKESDPYAIYISITTFLKLVELLFLLRLFVAIQGSL